MELTLNGIPTPGAILGTRVSDDIINSINQSLGANSEMFSTSLNPFFSGYQTFMNQVLEPQRKIFNLVNKISDKIFKRDVFIPIESEKDLEFIPPCMMYPIILFEPIRTLLKENRIDGFGYDEINLPEENPYERLINNGVIVADRSNGYPEDGYWFTITITSLDPKLTDEELEYIQRTYTFLKDFLETTDYDPTNYPDERG